MATSYTVNTADFLKSGTNCSITDCTTWDSSSFFTSMAKPLIGDKYNYTWGVICTRFRITPTKKIKSVTLSISYNNKAHGTGGYVNYYCKVSTSGSAWPTSNKDAAGAALGQLADSGTLTVSLSFEPTDEAVYVYIWGYLNSDSIGEHTVWLNSVASVSAVKGGVALWAKKDSTTWVQASAVYVKVNSTTWKEVAGLYAKKNGTTWAEAK